MISYISANEHKLRLLSTLLRTDGFMNPCLLILNKGYIQFHFIIIFFFYFTTSVTFINTSLKILKDKLDKLAMQINFVFYGFFFFSLCSIRDIIRERRDIRGSIAG